MRESELKDYINGLMKNNIIKGFRVSAIKKKFAGISENEIVETLEEFINSGDLEKECEMFCSYCHSVIKSFPEKERSNFDVESCFCRHCERDLDVEDTYICYSYKKV